jgi:hypothetical protein
MPALFLEPLIGKDNHSACDAIDDVWKSRTIIDVRGITVPIDNQIPLVQKQAQLAADDPAHVGQPFAANRGHEVRLSAFGLDTHAIREPHDFVDQHQWFISGQLFTLESSNFI